MILISGNDTLYRQTIRERGRERERGRDNESKKESGIRIIKHGKRVAVSFSATLQMNSCNDPGKAKIQSNNIYWASFSLLRE